MGYTTGHCSSRFFVEPFKKRMMEDLKKLREELCQNLAMIKVLAAYLQETIEKLTNVINRG